MQGIFGINKKKPVIHIQKSKDETELHVYIGFAFFEIIPNDCKSFQFRYFVARLAKAGFSLVAIARAFGINVDTVKRYRTILTTSQHEQELFERLVGLHCKKTKLTIEVESFINIRFKQLYLTNRRDYNQQLRDEIYQTFGITLSSEALRQVIAPLRKEIDNKQTTPDNEIDVDNTISDQTRTLDEATDTDIVKPKLIADLLENGAVAKNSFNKSDNGFNFFHSAGLLIFNLWLQKFMKQLKVEAAPLLQWIYQILYGAVNFEQARYFPRHELKVYTSFKTNSVTQSHYQLSVMAYQEFEAYQQALFDANLAYVSTSPIEKDCCYFYIDGHFDPYVGKLDILKGWCAVKNRLMKGTNHYIIHNDQGYPVIVELKDCFDSFRHTIKNMIPRVKALVSHQPEVRVGLIYDRGGFSEQLFELHDRSNTHFITWEVNFQAPDEKELQFTDQFTLYQEKNDIGKFKEISIDFLETTYKFAAGYKCRKFIVKRNNENSAKISSVLTNDKQANGKTIITYLLQRWMCQENDFKYEKAHFGLDEITSYAYEQLSVKDRIQQQQGEIKALEKQLETLKAERLKVLKPLGLKILTNKKIEQIQNNAAINGALTKELQIVQQYQQLKSKIIKYRDRINKQQKALERKEKIENNGYIRLDLRKKQILDQLKIIARNIFYNAVSEFKMFYGNLRDLHVVLRQLSQSPGFIYFQKDEIHVYLCCSFTGKAQQAVKHFLEYLNERAIKMFDNTNRSIKFYLQN